MKKIVKKFVIILLFIIPIIMSLFIGISISRYQIVNKNDFSCLKNQSDKVILFIGDGMGENHIKVTSDYLQKELFINSIKKQGYVSTFSNSIFSPTDSAAAATALATGKKVDNKEVSMHKNKDIETISEYAKQLNKGVGIITTDSLNGATPACFSSHVSSRNLDNEIIKKQATSNIDLFLGAGKNTYLKHKQLFIDNNYNYIDSFSLLTICNNKLIAPFEKINNYNATDLLPTLPQLVSFAIDYMEYNYHSGYFLMIEGAHIDKKSHNNDIFSMISYLDEFDHSISTAFEKTSSFNNCTIIVTSDHETGNLNYNTNDKISNNLYKSKGHTKKNVKYFMNINTKDDIDYDIPNKIDNTDIFKICKALLSKKEPTI